MDDEAPDHFGRKPGEAFEVAEVAVGQALVGGEIRECGDLAGLQNLPLAPCPADGAQEAETLCRGSANTASLPCMIPKAMRL